MDSSTSPPRTGPFLFKECLVSFTLLQSFVEISVVNATGVHPDQTPRSAASDRGLHCLTMSLYRTLGLNGLTFVI